MTRLAHESLLAARKNAGSLLRSVFARTRPLQVVGQSTSVSTAEVGPLDAHGQRCAVLEGDGVQPKWVVLGGVELAAGGLFALVQPPTTALYWYIWPLFGLGGCYVVQFRSELSTRWRLTLAGTAVLSAVALRLDWAFSGHVLWNILFIGHAWMTGKRDTTWMRLLVASLAHLVVLKLAFQTSRDVAGAGLSAALAAVVLLTLRDQHDGATDVIGGPTQGS